MRTFGKRTPENYSCFFCSLCLIEISVVPILLLFACSFPMSVVCLFVLAFFAHGAGTFHHLIKNYLLLGRFVLRCSRLSSLCMQLSHVCCLPVFRLGKLYELDITSRSSTVVCRLSVGKRLCFSLVLHAHSPCYSVPTSSNRVCFLAATRCLLTLSHFLKLSLAALSLFLIRSARSLLSLSCGTPPCCVCFLSFSSCHLLPSHPFSLLFTRSVCPLLLQDVPSGRLVHWFAVPEAVTSLSFSANGEFLATTHVDNLGVFLWVNRGLYADVTLKPVAAGALGTARSKPRARPGKMKELVCGSRGFNL